MEYNIDEYKINDNKIFIKGWAHQKKYKIKVVCDGVEKLVKKYHPRYDICLLFHEKTEANLYGFKEELEFNKKIKKTQIYIISGKEEKHIINIDNRKIIIILKKIKRVLGRIKRGIIFLWKEHHFLVPPTMIKKYLKLLINKDYKTILYNPNVNSEYQTWLNNQKYDTTNEIKKITIIGDNEEELNDITISRNDSLSEQIKNVKTKYTCIVQGKVKFHKGFHTEINKYLDNNYDLIYYDNDRFIENKNIDPIFKPDWSRDSLLGVNYIGNCFIIKTSLLKKMNLSKINAYEILLNSILYNVKVLHIHKILYHDYNEITNGYKELKQYIIRNKISAEIKKNPDGITNTVIYKPIKKSLISIIIPTKDHADILEQCLKSIYEKSTYKNFEIIVIDNNSCEQSTFDLLEKYSKRKNFSYKRIECEFNYSYLNNEAVKMAKGEYILLLNNDIEVISDNFLETMLGYAEQKHIGIVGTKLLFPDDTIQHAGIIMGKGGLAGHSHYGKPKDYISSQYELKIPYDYSACTAACIMMSKDKYLEVGGLEETLKVAFNDVDLNLKMLEKGYNNIFLPNICLYHYESKSRGLDTTVEKQKRFMQEWSYIKNKWEKYLIHDPYYNDNFSKNDDYMLK